MTKQERAARTREALIRSAAREFDQHGYTLAKLSAISTGAGVSPGALHFHFENKPAVASAVEHEASTVLRRAARTVYGQGTNALQNLVDTTHALARLLREDIVVRAGYRLSCSRGCRTDLNPRQEWLSCVQQRLAEAADEGLLATGHGGQQDLVRTVVAATVGLEALCRDNAEWLSPGTVTGVWRTLLPMLAAPGTLAGLEPAGSPAVPGHAPAPVG
ncbi:ScbR family autoregulator-binding transcription factor [Streptomyces sp. TX20-6-3]|uniref:ScbR family autoregulator-binding transcription factor n=1 Tax=Streptomyces sp. TX20-6-3 TaxID=3028705 RepID=UPI0029A1702D|nr:ScbR family autoregulator-binding transcription factor [Streptomyces sp. TX20-6-3]MDX2564780.1 ScbR family autoregulator-binding transcription factor [Streptomyces sp. TX20-6-3]